jgi:hypothetical protein
LVWIVVYHPEAELEYHALSVVDRSAVDNAVRKLETYGPTLPYPHQSAVRGSVSIRELRPRGGRSRVRPLYRRFADTFVIGAVGPEAQVDPRRFERAVRSATTRFAEIEE